MMPKVGMSYSEVATRIKRIQSNPGHPQAKANIINSLKNQCRLAEGESALNALESECSLNHKRIHSFTGAGHKQVGWGSGKKLGDGHWQYTSNGWIRIS